MKQLILIVALALTSLGTSNVGLVLIVCEWRLAELRKPVRDSGCDDLRAAGSGGQAEVPSRDGAGPSTVRHAFRHG